MTEWILANIVTNEFQKVLEKFQGDKEKPKMMHIAVHFNPDHDKGDQYEVHHLYLYAPMNYVYVAVQEERIDARGKRHVGDMQILCYHDSCWRDSVQRFIFDNRDRLSSFRAYNDLFDWYDILDITQDEADYLRKAETFRRDSWKDKDAKFKVPNPFDKRGIWAKRD